MMLSLSKAYAPNHFRRYGIKASTLFRGSFDSKDCQSLRNPSTTKAVHSTTSLDDSKKPFVVTTPIYYVNSRPHIGHLYTSLLADASARYQRLKHLDILESLRRIGKLDPLYATNLESTPFVQKAKAGVIFASGTDEHGQKVSEAAVASGYDSTGKFVDDVSSSFQKMHYVFGVSHDSFVRTTHPEHARVVRWLWNELCSRGEIYLGEHEGWYCASDESFVPETQVIALQDYLKRKGIPHEEYSAKYSEDDLKKKVSAESGHAVEWLSEENYKFRLSNHVNEIIDLLETSFESSVFGSSRDQREQTAGAESIAETLPFLYPPLQYEETVALLKRGTTTDLSVSRIRSKVPWALEVPSPTSLVDNQPSNVKMGVATMAHSIYVWLDALTNYLTACRPAGESSSPSIGHRPLPVPASSGAWAEEYRAIISENGNEKLPELKGNWQKLFPNWPADLHIVGKDIVKFHAIYWPSFLKAANIPTPKRVLSHAHFTVSRQKMSKSLKNVVDPFDLLQITKPQTDIADTNLNVPNDFHTYTVDAVRYSLLREGNIFQDSDFNETVRMQRGIKECADTYGNLGTRLMTKKFFPFGTPAIAPTIVARSSEIQSYKAHHGKSQVGEGLQKSDYNLQHFLETAVEIGTEAANTCLSGKSPFAQPASSANAVDENRNRLSQDSEYTIVSSNGKFRTLLQSIDPALLQRALLHVDPEASFTALKLAFLNTIVNSKSSYPHLQSSIASYYSNSTSALPLNTVDNVFALLVDSILESSSGIQSTVESRIIDSMEQELQTLQSMKTSLSEIELLNSLQDILPMHGCHTFYSPSSMSAKHEQTSLPPLSASSPIALHALYEIPLTNVLLDGVMHVLQVANKVWNDTAPWKLIPSTKSIDFPMDLLQHPKHLRAWLDSGDQGVQGDSVHVWKLIQQVKQQELGQFLHSFLSSASSDRQLHPEQYPQYNVLPPSVLPPLSESTRALSSIAWTLLNTTRICSVYLRPIMPHSSEAFLSKMGLSPGSTQRSVPSSYQDTKPTWLDELHGSLRYNETKGIEQVHPFALPSNCDISRPTTLAFNIDTDSSLLLFPKIYTKAYKTVSASPQKKGLGAKTKK